MGGLFILGMLADLLGRYSPLPRVTILLIAGIIIGPSGFDVLPVFTHDWFPVLTNIALAMVGFLLGQKLAVSSLKGLGKSVLALSAGEVLLASVLTGAGLVLLGAPLELALLLAGIAPATAPAATFDVVREIRAKGKFTDTLLDIVAIDDAWGLVLFSLLLAAAQMLSGQGEVSEILLAGLWEVFGAILIGLMMGIPMSILTGRILPGEPTQAEALGWVLLCGGFALWMGVSFIIATIVLGAVVANFATHHRRPFHAIEAIEWPFMILFFLLAGASLHTVALMQVGTLGIAYIVLRSLGLITGAAVGGRLSRTDPQTSRLMGLALLPQAGVAIGMALIAAQRFPEYREIILPLVLGSTVIFELIGPFITRRVLIKVGDAKSK